MVDCCPQQLPMYHNGHTYNQQQAIALQQYYHNNNNNNIQYLNNNNQYSPTSSTSSSSSYNGYPSPPGPDFNRRVHTYAGFNNDHLLNRNYAYGGGGGGYVAGRMYGSRSFAAATQHHMHMYHPAAMHNGYYVPDTQVTR
ncbi:hypothetical protein LSTR_LSTR010958 [Laodelphax striatellus]|uniref:Uncharacterized protein n=1 Tax=Laodelphax striatellus TaxID=195883 RepID=A0A482XVR0_LAOST|nr:hypothetical protein LSTR_LSTR010958 [Laodelphax striatellus]